MSGKQVPADAPPSYQDATGASSSSSRPTHNRGNSSRLSVSNSVPDAARRSMEDEHRPLPKGWVRTFDPESQHQFFVDTRQDPPRSIWHHPYDDEEYLRTLSSDERERIEQESMGRGKQPSHADIMASHTDDEEDEHAHASSSSSHHHDAAELPPRPDGKGKGKVSFGRKLKDKITGTTAEQREAERKRRAEEERRMYEQHRRVREAMTKAMETGQPQLVGKDKNGKDVYVDPPNTTAGPAGFGTNSPGSGYSGGYYGGYGGYGGYGPGMYSPYRYARPYGPYGRPYGGGFGGGYGLPLALGGGLMGGLLLGDALGGGF